MLASAPFSRASGRVRTTPHRSGFGLRFAPDLLLEQPLLRTLEAR